jgi:hypothetical protein
MKNKLLEKEIDEMFSVYTAEAKIFDACLILKNNSYRRVAIATDSLSTERSNKSWKPGTSDQLDLTIYV